MLSSCENWFGLIWFGFYKIKSHVLYDCECLWDSRERVWQSSSKKKLEFNFIYLLMTFYSPNEFFNFFNICLLCI